MAKKTDNSVPEERELSPEEFRQACEQVNQEIQEAFKRIVKEEFEALKHERKV